MLTKSIYRFNEISVNTAFRFFFSEMDRLILNCIQNCKEPGITSTVLKTEGRTRLKDSHLPILKLVTKLQ